MFSKPIDPLPRYKAGYMEAVNQIAALTKRAEQAEAVAAGLRLLAMQYRALLILDEGQYGFSCKICAWTWDRGEPQRHHDSCLLATPPDAAASALYAAAQELAAAFDDEGPWQSGPTQAQYDRQAAALAAWRRAAAAGGTGAEEEEASGG